MGSQSYASLFNAEGPSRGLDGQRVAVLRHIQSLGPVAFPPRDNQCRKCTVAADPENVLAFFESFGIVGSPELRLLCARVPEMGPIAHVRLDVAVAGKQLVDPCGHAAHPQTAVPVVEPEVHDALAVDKGVEDITAESRDVIRDSLNSIRRRIEPEVYQRPGVRLLAVQVVVIPSAVDTLRVGPQLLDRAIQCLSRHEHGTVSLRRRVILEIDEGIAVPTSVPHPILLTVLFVPNQCASTIPCKQTANQRTTAATKARPAVIPSTERILNRIGDGDRMKAVRDRNE